MKTRQVVSSVAAILAALSLGYSTQRTARFLGTPSNLGNGTVASYAKFDKSGAPKAIGVVFSTGAPGRFAGGAVRRASVFRR